MSRPGDTPCRDNTEGTRIDILYVGCLAPMQRGGSGVLGVELVAGLSDLGHRVRTLTPCPAGVELACAAFEARHPDVQATWLPIPVASSELLEGSRDPGYRRAEDAGIRSGLPRLIARRRPDVILVGRESVIAEVPPVARRCGIPTVALVQGGRALQRIVASDPDALARRQRGQLGQVNAVIAIARHIQEALAPLSLRRVTVIPNPVDLERFSPGAKPPALLQAYAIHPQEVVVAHFSNLGPLKRPLDVIESAARVLSVDPRLVYLIVGEGPYRGPMEARCRELGIARRVRFVGWIEHSEMPAHLRLADIVVMPSESEGLPLVYLETLASGRLLVASDIPAARELVVDGETGLIARRGDVADLATNTLRGASDPALRAAIGRAARAATHAHTKPAILAAYARLLEELAGRRASGRPGPVATGASASRLRMKQLGQDLRTLVEAQGQPTTPPASTSSARSAGRSGKCTKRSGSEPDT